MHPLISGGTNLKVKGGYFVLKTREKSRRQKIAVCLQELSWVLVEVVVRANGCETRVVEEELIELVK